MLFPHLPPRCLAALGLALVVASRAPAQLAANSPFIPPAAAGASVPVTGGTIEYLGYMQTREGRLFRLYDPARKARVWARLNEPNAELGVVVKKHDADKGTLTIEHRGKVLTLEEPKAKVASGGAPVPQPPPVASTVPAAVTQAVVLNPTPADEARRLDAVAAEVQRRRALRDQAAQQVNQGVTAPVGAPAPAMGPVPAVPGGFVPGLPQVVPPLNAVGAQPR